MTYGLNLIFDINPRQAEVTASLDVMVKFIHGKFPHLDSVFNCTQFIGKLTTFSRLNTFRV